MGDKKRYDFNDYFQGFLYILALLCFVYFLIVGNQPKTLEPILIIVVLTIVKVLTKAINIEIFFALRFSILSFIFVAMFLANEFSFYAIIPALDKIEHLFSGAMLAFVGLVIFRYLNRKEKDLKINPDTITFFSLFFSIAMAGCWEIYEFTTDNLFNLRSQNASLVDTMLDIICGTTGAVLTSIYMHYKIR